MSISSSIASASLAQGSSYPNATASQRNTVAGRDLAIRDSQVATRNDATITQRQAPDGSGPADTRREAAINRQTEANRLAEAKRQAEKDNAAPAGGRVQFKYEEGERVMKVLDSKDVLIYQVPSKGQLTLLKAQEANTSRQLEALA